MKKFIIFWGLFFWVIHSVSASIAGDNIIISEVQYDAVAPDQAGEWFELYNPTGAAIDISGWTVTDGEGVVTIPAASTIASGAYFVATHTATGGFLTNYPSIPVDLEYGAIDVGNLAMANTSDELILADGLGVIDGLSWGPSGGFAYLTISASEGTTLARSTSTDTDTEADWASNQVASPGSGTLTLINSDPTDIVLSATAVAENSAVGAVVGTLTTSDVDTADSHTYSFIAGVGDEDNAQFTISTSNIELNFTPDYENPIDTGDIAGNNTYSIRVQTDDGNGGVFEKNFIISVTDIVEVVVKKGGGKSAPRKKNGPGKTTYTCKKTQALNFSNTGIHKESLCIYEKEKEVVVVTPTIEVKNSCSLDMLLTQNMKMGDRNNQYSVWEKGMITEVKILQTHMNRLGFDSGIVDGILGPRTDNAIKQMQKSLGTTQDGYVGIITRELINNSCN